MKDEHSKSTLMGWTKADLADYIICLEQNYKQLQKTFDVQYSNCMKLLDDMKVINDTYKKAKRTEVLSNE